MSSDERRKTTDKHLLYRMKPLLPSLKEKRRYVAFEVIAQSRFTERDVADAIIASMLEQVGRRGLSRAGLKFVPESWDADKMRGVVRVAHDAAELLKSTFPFIKTIKNKSVIVRSVGTSGLLAKLQATFGLKKIETKYG